MKKIFLILALVFLSSCHTGEEVIPQIKNIVDAVFASGQIAYTHEYNITAISEGYLITKYAEEGDSVVQGQKIFQLDNSIQSSLMQDSYQNYVDALADTYDTAPQIKELEEQIKQARLKKDLNGKNLKRYEALLKTHAISIQEYENSLLAYQSDSTNLSVLNKSLEDLKIKLNQRKNSAYTQYKVQHQNNAYLTLTSQSAGVILNVYKQSGDLLKKGETIAKIGAGQICVVLDIAEDDIDRIRLGQEVLVSLNTQKDRTYKAFISKIYPSFDVVNQSFKVEAVFAEKPSNLLNGVQLQANIIVDKKQDAIVIPTNFLLNGDSVLFKKNRKKIKITTGIRSAEWVEVTSGLTEKDVLVLPKK